MAYDENLADRVRCVLDRPLEVREQKMFGGLAFMTSGHMFCGVVGDRLMLRLGEAGAERALDQPHVSLMDFTGKAMRTMVYVEPDGIVGDAALQAWVERAAGFVATLPPKGARS